MVLEKPVIVAPVTNVMTPSPSGFQRLGGLFRAILRYVEARGELLQIEAQEAGEKAVVLVIAVAVAVTALILAWLLALPALVWIIADAGGWHWSSVSLVAAAIHLGICAIAFGVFRMRLKTLRVFEESLGQLKEDRKWIGKEAGE